MTFENAVHTAEFIRSIYPPQINTAVVLGSGLGAFADQLENSISIPFEEIPDFAKATVDGHEGRLVLGELAGVNLLVQAGRFHYYEGYDMQQVVFPVRVFGCLGIKNLILTNAAGSLDTEMQQGSLMLITDHINLMGANPLLGKNDERFGPRFPDMTQVYDIELQHIASEEAAAIIRDISVRGEDASATFLHRGVYCGLSGPTYETPAEIHMYRLLGADAVGMSTVPEAIAARHQGMKVLGISCITNLGAGMIEGSIDHDAVMETGARVAETFTELLRRIILRISQ
jgi:purine-nucleoside phosphorylase